MRNNHITALLDERSMTSLTGKDIADIEAHVGACPECMKAYEAANISLSLIRERAAETVEVSPFFQTRVMAAIREGQVAMELPALLRMWKAAGSLVSALACAVVILVGFTVFGYNTYDPARFAQVSVTQNIYSAEYVVFEPDESSEDTIPYDQVLGTIYNSEDDDGN